jgi:hypothetical protein
MEARRAVVVSLVMEEGEGKKEQPIKIDWEGKKGKRCAMTS